MGRNLYLFDCFGVVISDVSTIFMEKRGFDAQQILFMRNRIFRSVDVGKLTMSQMFEKTSEHFCFDTEKMKEEWTGYEYVLDDTVTLVKRLKDEGHVVALLSNAEAAYVDYLFDKFGLKDLFHFVFVSSNYGCAKPDYEFYKLCLDSFDERFDAVYFADNNPDNLVGLEPLGITPILFTSAQDFLNKVNLK